MNILPKKKWHVRTKENMIRVRRDEAKAAEEEKRILDREILATNESRLSLLKKRAEERQDNMFGVRRHEDTLDTQPSSSSKHVNFFEELEMEEGKNIGKTNNEYEEEKKKKEVEWYSKMGIQSALAEGSAELSGGMWYEKIPLRKGAKEEAAEEAIQREANKTTEERVQEKLKELERRKGRREDSCGESSDERHKKKKKKGKKRKRSSYSSDEDRKRKKKKRKKNRERRESRDEEEEKKATMGRLRDERLKRERMEQARTMLVLHPQLLSKKEQPQPKYNSMFNPHLAR